MHPLNKKGALIVTLVRKLFFGFFEVVRPVFFLEAFDAACGIDVLLLACIERVANRADFRVDFAYGAAGFKGVAAAAVHHDLIVFRMYVFLHKILPNNQKHYFSGIAV